MSMTPAQKKKLDELENRIEELKAELHDAESKRNKYRSKCWDWYSFTYQRYLDPIKGTFTDKDHPWPNAAPEFAQDTMYALSIEDLHYLWLRDRNFGRIIEDSIKLMEKPKRKRNG